ncbi:hypothetical protein ACFL35_06740 [Candidatus Riflebacteria bacterium]
MNWKLQSPNQQSEDKAVTRDVTDYWPPQILLKFSLFPTIFWFSIPFLLLIALFGPDFYEKATLLSFFLTSICLVTGFFLVYLRREKLTEPDISFCMSVVPFFFILAAFLADFFFVNSFPFTAEHFLSDVIESRAYFFSHFLGFMVVFFLITPLFFPVYPDSFPVKTVYSGLLSLIILLFAFSPSISKYHYFLARNESWNLKLNGFLHILFPDADNFSMKRPLLCKIKLLCFGENIFQRRNLLNRAILDFPDYSYFFFMMQKDKRAQKEELESAEINRISEWVSRFPFYGPYRSMLADVWYEKGEFSLSAHHYHWLYKERELTPIQLARFAYSSSKKIGRDVLEDSVELATAALRGAPWNKEIFLILGKLYFKKGELEKAEEYLQKAEGFKEPLVLEELKRLFEESNSDEKLIPVLQKILKYEKEDSKSYQQIQDRLNRLRLSRKGI